ncbi:MAG: flagellar basal body-associated FliL family protein [Chromatiales bacterium]|nr:flagellar basal body-associated FliL family protein [Chromatiales bacterium]
MADANIDEDLDLGVEKGSKKKLIIIIAGVVLLLVIGAAAWFVLGGSGEEGAEEQEEEVVLPAAYHSLEKFVVNLPPGGRAKMLQVGVDLMVRDPATIEFLTKNDPMVRHNLLNLFGEQEAATLVDRAGKEKLQATVLETLNKIITEQAGPGEVEAVYFSSFVMQ